MLQQTDRLRRNVFWTFYRKKIRLFNLCFANGKKNEENAQNICALLPANVFALVTITFAREERLKRLVSNKLSSLSWPQRKC